MQLIFSMSKYYTFLYHAVMDSPFPIFLSVSIFPSSHNNELFLLLSLSSPPSLYLPPLSIFFPLSLSYPLLYPPPLYLLPFPISPPPPLSIFSPSLSPPPPLSLSSPPSLSLSCSSHCELYEFLQDFVEQRFLDSIAAEYKEKVDNALKCTCSLLVGVVS